MSTSNLFSKLESSEKLEQNFNQLVLNNKDKFPQEKLSPFAYISPALSGKEKVETINKKIEMLKYLVIYIPKYNKSKMDEFMSKSDLSIEKVYKSIKNIESNIYYFNKENRAAFRQEDYSISDKIKISSSLDKELHNFKKYPKNFSLGNYGVIETMKNLVTTLDAIKDFSSDDGKKFYDWSISMWDVNHFKTLITKDFKSCTKDQKVKFIGNRLQKEENEWTLNKLETMDSEFKTDFYKSDFSISKLFKAFKAFDKYNESYSKMMGTGETLDIYEVPLKALMGLSQLLDQNKGKILSPTEIDEKYKSIDDREKKIKKEISKIEKDIKYPKNKKIIPIVYSAEKKTLEIKSLENRQKICATKQVILENEEKALKSVKDYTSKFKDKIKLNNMSKSSQTSKVKEI